MLRPKKQPAQKALMTEAHKAALKELEARRREDGHAARVDAFNAMLIADLGRENCDTLLRSYN